MSSKSSNEPQECSLDGRTGPGRANSVLGKGSATNVGLPWAGPESRVLPATGSRGGRKTLYFPARFGGLEVVLGAYRENHLEWLHRQLVNNAGVRIGGLRPREYPRIWDERLP